MTTSRNPEVLIRAFLDEGLVEMPDRAYDAVRRDIQRTRQRVVFGPVSARSAGGYAVAIAAALVLAIGFAWGILPPGDPGQSAQPTTEASPSSRPLPTGPVSLEPGAYVLDYGFAPGSDQAPGASVVVTVPSNAWSTTGSFAFERNTGQDDIQADASFVAWRITALPLHPCTNHAPAFPEPGPTVDDLLEAVASQVGLRAGPISDIELGGHAARFVEVQVTANVGACPGGFLMWATDGAEEFADLRNEIFRMYAVQIENDRLTFFARVPRLVTPVLGAPQARDELDALIDSIEIRP